MKKLMFVALLALAGAHVSRDEAQAWTKFNMGVAANMDWATGGSKNLMWGLYKCSDTPLVSSYWEGTTPNCAGPYGAAGAGLQPFMGGHAMGSSPFNADAFAGMHGDFNGFEQGAALGSGANQAGSAAAPNGAANGPATQTLPKASGSPSSLLPYYPRYQYPDYVPVSNSWNYGYYPAYGYGR